MARYEGALYLKRLQETPCFDYPVTERIRTEEGRIFFDS